MINHKHSRVGRARIIENVCLCILCVLLVVGLWPFHSPRNDVTWLANENGLYFGRHASIISIGSFPAHPYNSTVGTIELWLAPSLLRGSHTILSFEGSVHPGVPFSVRQDKDAIVVVQHNEDGGGISWTAWSVVHGTFNRGMPAFVTIAVEPGKTSIYLNGVLTKSATILGDSANNFTGRLLLANSPGVNNGWSGKILGMAIYDQQLTQGEVLEHYQSWTKRQTPNTAQEEAPIALYLFDERGGDIAHNEFDHRTDLKIPSRYFVLHQRFLTPVWRGYHATWSYWGDFIINVVGFVPLGFFAGTYFSSVRPTKRAVAITVVLGFVTSLLIETLQAFLPTRDSGMNDLVTNTLGTALGALLSNLAWLQRILDKTLGICNPSLDFS